MVSDPSQPAERRAQRRQGQFRLTTLLLVVTGVSLAVSLHVVRRNGVDADRAGRQLMRLGRVAFGVCDFWRDNGRIPAQEEGLALMMPGAWSAGSRSYLAPSEVTDEWGNAIIYIVSDGRKADGFDLRSVGPNGIDDGGADDDISLRHGFDRAPYDTAALRMAVGSLFLGLLIGVFLSVIERYATYGRQPREGELALTRSGSSEATP